MVIPDFGEGSGEDMPPQPLMFGPISKLVDVQLWSDDWQDGVQNQFFQAFHDY